MLIQVYLLVLRQFQSFDLSRINVILDSYFDKLCRSIQHLYIQLIGICSFYVLFTPCAPL